ncbi:unnamed protein product [Clonostachys solani]|uniref:Uncharacterized protein n=1 Tax=Clonostachys solani TaxID=160281 RepID=A0A9N9YXL3_9HYPO|nr:unnamed protein product [Clonostachys solani]
MFFYSGSNDDCSEHKMVGVINPVSRFQGNVSLTAVLMLACQTEGKNLRLWNDDSRNFTVQVQEESKDDESPGTLYSRSCGDGDFILGAGQVVGIALGGAAAILIAGLLGFFCHRHSVDGPVHSRHIRGSSYPAHYQSKYTAPAITGCRTPRFTVRDWDKKRMEQLIEEAEKAQCPKAIPRYSQSSSCPISTPCKCLGGEDCGQSPATRRYENVSLPSMYEPLSV